MCLAFKKAEETVNEFLDRKEIFTWDELQDAVINNGGVLMVSSGIPLGEYMESFIDMGIIYYDEYTRKYGFISDIDKSIEERKEEFQIPY